MSRMWKSNISFQTKFQLFKSLVVSILLYGCEIWTLLADDERRIQALETRCLRKLLRISYRKLKTSDYVRSLLRSLVAPQEPLLATVRRRKLAWFGHVMRHVTLSKTITRGTVEGGPRRGRQRKSRSDNVKDWTAVTFPHLLSTAANRTACRRTAASSALRSPRRLQKSRE